MKFSIVMFVTLLSSGSGANGNIYEYRGQYVTTEEAQDMAICGTNIDGCVSLPATQWSGCYKVQAQFAPLNAIEETKHSNKLHKWIYEDGLLKPEHKPSNWLSWAYSAKSKNGLCLGPKAEQLRSTEKSYKLFLQHCPEEHEAARHMRFIMTDEGKVQSLAPVEDAELKYCMSTFGLENNEMFLRPCNSKDEKLDQELRAYGTVNTFALPLQDEWGVDDVVELGYSFAGNDNNLAETSLEIYKTGYEGEITHAMTSSASSGIFAFKVSNLRDVIVGEYKAKFERNGIEHMVNFFVGGEVHFSFDDNFSSYDYTQNESDINLGILIGIVIAGALFLVGIGGTLFYFIRKRAKAKAGVNAVTEDMKADDDMTVAADVDDPDTMSLA